MSTSEQKLKEETNKHIYQQKYVSAAIKYRQAIELDPKNTTLSANHALCRLKLKHYPDVVEDASEVQSCEAQPMLREGICLGSMIGRGSRHSAVCYGSSFETRPDTSEIALKETVEPQYPDLQRGMDTIEHGFNFLLVFDDTNLAAHNISF
ncbi:small glutamine-rich tetratricopeptide repeat - beta [Moniliophthora roreri MCA 2997]|uniref:Small glutamine-rich tetratricopeptide repeat-beta n=2 Tax=Moniliophthora roreri TaxID=221103 RepID=V2XCQ2_MONRO|nr:small glutamine-rich tetratricopeptide repeat - beta [Moniliophthora roreri MCA 2997]KAI3603950.1 small glutamine-rich tetratricopeptide repeat-beta [Moniliophthora roreri]